MTEFEWIDDCFRVEEKRWGTWTSYDKEDKELITSLHKEICISATRWYLKHKQEGFVENEIKYEGVVGGKL
jgi:hypothetical protein